MYYFVFHTDVQQDVNDEQLAEVCEKLILHKSMVMSKTEICGKLKHITDISKSRDNIISALVKEGLLIEGNWFAVKGVNGNVRLKPGYLKAFPKDTAKDQQEFARLLAKYGIHFHDFEQSFKKEKNDLFPRTITASDIKYNDSWLFSTELFDVIEKNTFLRERVVLDPSAYIRESNGKNYF